MARAVQQGLRQLSGRPFLSINDLKRDTALSLFSRAKNFYDENVSGSKHDQSLAGRVILMLFLEPSTRTFQSFASAAQSLGASVQLFDVEKSSLKKGESMKDTLRAASALCDALVIRHPQKGFVREAAELCSVPVINAGDGPGEHPTQALGDFATVMGETGRLDNHKIVIGGDLAHSRAIHSFTHIISRFMNDAQVTCVSEPEIALPEKYVEQLQTNNVDVNILHDLSDEVLKDATIFYVDRCQPERFKCSKMYERVSNKFRITPDKLNSFPSESILMHPLPREGQLCESVDELPQSRFFDQQIRWGLAMRKALLESTLA